MSILSSELMKAIIETRYDEISELVRTSINDGSDPIIILEELRKGLSIVGKKYQEGEYFLSQLFLAAETMKKAIEILNPLLMSSGKGNFKGTIVIGSIEGDIHDFGKTIVSSLLIAEGYNVIDLGIDVPVTRFVEEAERVNADIIGISALLTTTQPQSLNVVKRLEEKGIRDKFRIILGGTGVDPKHALQHFGVDGAVNDGVEAVKIINSWLEVK